jgi:choline-sulfatase
MHGFEDRFTTDIYPADFGWTPDYRKPGERIDWWYHNMGSVTGSGVAEISNQMEYDDEVAYHATRKIYDLARGHDARPWALTVSFTHPHDPYVARRKYWDLYEDCEHLLPPVGAIPYEEQDPHSQRILDANDRDNFNITEEDIMRSRRAYFANISYLDDKIGEVMEALESTRQEAVILFLSDHGDMLGDRGLWFKMCFYEGSARVPLMISGAGFEPGLIEAPVSTIDVTPTLAALAGHSLEEIAPWTEGVDLAPIAAGGKRPDVAMEYAAEGSYAPVVGFVGEFEGSRYKFTKCELDPSQLFDLDADPHEQTDLADSAQHKSVLIHFEQMAEARWDLAQFDAQVRESQARRWVVYEALRNGNYYPWDFQPLQVASERYMRNHMDLNVLEDGQRFPRGE